MSFIERYCGIKSICSFLNYFKNLPIHWRVFLFLVAYSLALTLLTGNIGFYGDDWWIFNVPFWHEYPGSIGIYSREFLRPVEGAYWLTLFEIFGFNEPLFHFFSLVLLAFAAFLMGACLENAFPCRPSFIAASMSFAFFLPTVSSLTYLMTTDNSRLCAIFFWGATLAFQRWSMRPESWIRLAQPIFLYYISVSTYEAASLLIFCVPFFVWPIHLRRRGQISDLSFLFRLGSGILAGFSLFLTSRFLILQGGAVKGSNYLLTSPTLILDYFSNLFRYILIPFGAVSTDVATWAVSIVVALFAAVFLFQPNKDINKNIVSGEPESTPGLPFMMLAGGSVLILGMAPYLLAGYGAVFNFISSSRIYSSATFGVAILLGSLITSWRDKRILVVMKVLGVTLIGFMAMLQLDLRRDWQEAARINRNLWTSFIRQAPGVTPNTTFLFLDLQSYIGDRAIVFGGTHGLDAFIQMLYRSQNVHAYYLYLYDSSFINSEGRLAYASPNGIVARNSPPDRPIPLENLLIFRRVGDQLVLLEKISSEEDLAAIQWDDISIIMSNRKRVLPSEDIYLQLQEICPMCLDR